jgi:GDPmannose 4,6-dehydratase
LFNHESPIRGETFVTRKITRALARLKTGLSGILHIGNLDAKRDWGHARDYVEMQWLMLQQDKPEDYVIATGEHYSVREFIEIAARKLGLSIRWEGAGVDEKGINEETGKVMVAVDPRYFRPTEVQDLLGDAGKARKNLGWKPRITFEQLVAEMVEADMQEAQKDYLCQLEGFQTFNHFDT